MKERDHNMLKLVSRIAMQQGARLQAVKDAARIPDECGPAIAPAPARGGFVLHRNVELLPVGSDKVEAVHRGFGGRSAIRRADVFDGMIAAALRAKRPAPLAPGQIAMGRRYHDLVELLSADGTKLSQWQSAFGSGDGADWMDRRLVLSAELDGIRRRIGTGAAMSVRRVRPSQRGGADRGVILDRTLVDMVCLMGYGIKAVLTAHGWQADGRNQAACKDALSAALDRMIGYRMQGGS